MNRTKLPPSTTIYVDADACPVKQEVYRVAERHGLAVKVVSNSGVAVPREYSRPRPDGEPGSTSANRAAIERVVVAAGPDAADDWIAERSGASDIVVTADIPLAARCVKAGAHVLAPNGRTFDEAAIGLALATRNLMDSLRSAGAVTGGPRPFSPRDRSAFLQALERAVMRLKRGR